MASFTMRNYTQAHTTLSSLLAALPDEHQHAMTAGSMLVRMQAVVQALWTHFGVVDGSPRDGLPSISWVGFYAAGPGADEMTLACREPKPACSPIGLHGMCGKGYQDKTTYIVPDVRVLGPNYIACDPRDQSELVVPVLLADGKCWGVLDVDSYGIGAFTMHDATEMQAMLQAAHLLWGMPAVVTIEPAVS